MTRWSSATSPKYDKISLLIGAPAGFSLDASKTTVLGTFPAEGKYSFNYVVTRGKTAKQTALVSVTACAAGRTWDPASNACTSPISSGGGSSSGSPSRPGDSYHCS